MSDPRSATTNRVGAGPQSYTYKIDNSDITFDATKPGRSASVGLAVMITSNGTVRLTGDGARIAGKLLSVADDGYCAVQVEGVVTLPSNGTTTAGTQAVGALGPASARGYIRSVVAATLADVAAGSGYIEDASDAANVEIDLTA